MQTTTVSANWLMAQDSAAITILDASYFLPTMGRDGRSEFAEEHIVGAAFFDIDAIKDEANPLPHMMPDSAVFEAAMRDIGVCSNKQIVVYDNSPFLSAARAWWTLRYFGHRAVCVLDGGMAAWKAAGGQTENGATAPEAGDFTAAAPYKAGLISFDELRRDVENSTA
ncbi:MAG: sulfurtransferase, partial [Candidatus Puniceispirillaceae bacterium]